MRSAWRSLLSAGGRLQTPARVPRPRLFSSPPSLSEIVSRPAPLADIRAELDSADPSFDHDAINTALRTLAPTPDLARGLFDWASAKDGGKLSSKSYNIMLGILGSSGRSHEFWDLCKAMRRKGYGISRETYSNASEGFGSKGLEKDLTLLKKLDFLNSPENTVGRMSNRICNVLRGRDSESVVRKKLDGLGAELSSELVIAVMERLRQSPTGMVIFLDWIEEKNSFKIDGRVYNVMARISGGKGCTLDLLLQRMRERGFELERETYIKVSESLYKAKKAKDAVDLFEFAMAGTEKPTARDFVLLMRKIVLDEDISLSSVSRAVRIFVDSGNLPKGSVFHSVLKMLRSVGRLKECSKVLKAMEDGGFVADGSVHDQVVVGLCDAGAPSRAVESKEDFESSEGLIKSGPQLAFEYLEGVEESGRDPGVKAWTSVVQRHTMSDELDKALSCFRRMVERRGGENVGCAFDVLVNGFCSKNKVEDAFNVLKEVVSKKGVQPWQSTYKFLIERLLSQGSLKEASVLLGLMKGHGYPPYIDPFIGHVSKLGTVDDAVTFLKAMTVKEFPSKAVFLRLFEELLKAGRQQAAHDLLSKSPGSVRNHADVLELFYSMKPVETASAAAM